MQSKVPGRYIIIPFLYVLLIAGLLYAQFGRASKIDLTIGNIEFSAYFPPGRGKNVSVPSQVSVHFGSMEFLSGSGRLIAADESGTQRPVKLLDYMTDTRRLVLDYETEVHVEIINTSPNRGAVEIRLMATDVSSIGFAVSEFMTQPDDRVPVFLENGTTALFPVGTRLDAKDHMLWVPMTSPAQSAVVYRVNPELIDRPFLFWLEEAYPFTSEDEVNRLRTGFLEAVYNGWTTTRFLETNNGWKLDDGTIGFDESALAYMTSESLLRGTFRDLYVRILNISRQHDAELTYRSAPLLGNIVRAGETIAGDDSKRVELIRTLLESGDPAVFVIDELVPFIVDRTPSSLAGELVKFASELTPDQVVAAEAIGAIEYLFSIGAIDPDLDIGRAAILERFSALILPFMNAGAFGLYLEAENGLADTSATIRAGFFLEDFGTGDNLYNGIGRELQKYGLRLADSGGFIPAYPDPSQPDNESSDGYLRPETIYQRITGNPYVPREISLFGTDGPGIWIWTTAGNFEIISTDESYTISFDFPVGSAHHLIFRGIEPFASVTLFGNQWRNDPLFQNYTSGWTYNTDEKTMYLKITHRNVREQIIIRK